ncbi:DUF1499 domain-containing protein [Pseudodesulfovibrio sp.]|nr:DUF1499 domain-containing protein [Pseudodesulfovibrio sp.]
MKYLIISTTVCLIALFALSACSNKTPDNLGLKDGRFAPCPETKNCVSSQAIDDIHKVAPIKAHGSTEVVMTDLSDAIESMFGSKVVVMNDTYLRAEYTTRYMRFVDDLECYYDEPNGIIHVRSASRVGYSDLGSNRKRIEELRKIFSIMQ